MSRQNSLGGGDAGSRLQQDFFPASVGEVVGNGGVVDAADCGAVVAWGDSAASSKCWAMLRRKAVSRSGILDLYLGLG